MPHGNREMLVRRDHLIEYPFVWEQVRAQQVKQCVEMPRAELNGCRGEEQDGLAGITDEASELVAVCLRGPQVVSFVEDGQGELRRRVQRGEARSRTASRRAEKVIRISEQFEIDD